MYFEVGLQAYRIFHQNCGFMNFKIEIYNEFGPNVTKRSPLMHRETRVETKRTGTFFYTSVTHHVEIIFLKNI